MQNRPDDSRELREANARFEYDVRNKGLDQAMQERQARNAARREQERRAAGESLKAFISNNVGRDPRLANGGRYTPDGD
jgi:hypothetical protein